MANFNELFKSSKPAAEKAAEPKPGMNGPTLGTYDDDDLLKLWKEIRRESIDQRWVFERQWMRNIYYVLGRQWIEYHSRQGGWKDKRMAKWVPRPVTNKCKETVQALRAMFTAIKLGVNVRPNGNTPENVSTAATADDMSPLLHEDHHMNAVLKEHDFWLTVTGNAFLHEYINYDLKNGTFKVASEQCADCGAVYTQDKITENVCPDCGSPNLMPALGEDGLPVEETRPRGKPATCALSPLELAFPNQYPRFEDLPYVVRLRWRPKHYFENHPKLKALVNEMKWAKAPADQSLQLFKSLSSHNDLGIAPIYWTEGMGLNSEDDGITEYEVWYKPCDAYPQGLVFRVYGDGGEPIVAHLEEDEAVPGPMPYKDVEGTPIFPFQHTGYDHVGGRILASGPLDVIIEKQNQLNQLDSMILLIIMRMANPVWLEPKGAEIERLTGMPGLVVKWNPLTVGGNAKPERIPGEGPHQSLFQIREQYLKDIEELAGTFDIVKGAKPTGVEAFSALQLLVERSQSRFADVFTSRGDTYKGWFACALELEREFGLDERTKWIMGDSHQWSAQTFQKAKLQGSVTIVIEDGSTIPKTNLGMRAAVEGANNLKMLNMGDPDVVYEGLKLFGLTKMVPSLDVHVQAALRKQKAFEDWLANPKMVQASMMQAQEQMVQYTQQLGVLQQNVATDLTSPIPQPPSMLATTPLKWQPWYNASIHRVEFMKWANSDRMLELMLKTPVVEQLLATHLQEIDQAIMVEMAKFAPPAPAPNQKQAGGGGNAMGNSNRESTQGNEPKGNSEGNQGQGPA